MHFMSSIKNSSNLLLILFVLIALNISACSKAELPVSPVSFSVDGETLSVNRVELPQNLALTSDMKTYTNELENFVTYQQNLANLKIKDAVKLNTQPNAATMKLNSHMERVGQGKFADQYKVGFNGNVVVSHLLRDNGRSVIILSFPERGLIATFFDCRSGNCLIEETPFEEPYIKLGAIFSHLQDVAENEK